jgi:hypothetical protein
MVEVALNENRTFWSSRSERRKEERMSEPESTRHGLDEIRQSIPNLTPEGKAELANAVVDETHGDAKKDVASAVVRAVPDELKTDVVAAAVRDAQDGAKKDVASAAVRAVPDELKTDVVSAAVQDAQGQTKKELASAAMRSLSAQDSEEVAGRFLPDQAVTNKIWLTIVRTFAAILVIALLALIAGIFMDVENALVQILLTVFTTVAGILAGFVSGRASVSRASR